jgi:FlaA1/EpsC-like NDP-sugar epimerase
MGSAGSVIPVFQKELQQENMIRITNFGMTRFFLSCQDAVRMALDALESGLGGEVFVPKMKAASLEMLSRIMIKHLGSTDTTIKEIGVRPGEKFTETLISRYETPRTRELGNMYVVLPFFTSEPLKNHYNSAPLVGFTECASDSIEQFTFEELEALLGHEGFLSRDGSPEAASYWKKDGWEFV